MTFMLHIKFDSGTHCGIGGYVLDEYDPVNKVRIFKPKSMEVISKILDVVGVNSLEELSGQYIRFEDNGWGSRITKIGNFMEDKWLDFEEFFSVKGENK